MITLRLKPEQQKAFDKLKAAYKACEKAGIYFVNNHGTIEGYDSEFVAGYGCDDDYNRKDKDVLSSQDVWVPATFEIAGAWADDEHLIKLTPKGRKKLDNGEY